MSPAKLDYVASIPLLEGEPLQTPPVAMHEAAHLVIAKMVGMDVLFASVEPDIAANTSLLKLGHSRADGAIGMRHPIADATSPRDRRLLLVALAGTVGQNVLLFSQRPISADDFEAAMELAFEFQPWNPMGLLNDACNLLAQIFRLEPVAQTAFNFAEALRVRKTIVAPEIAQLWETMAPLPQLQWTPSCQSVDQPGMVGNNPPSA